MINDINLTYTRYPRSESPPQREKAAPLSVDKKPGNTKGIHKGIFAAPAHHPEMSELVDRLNKRAPHFGSDVSFEMSTDRRPHIVMKHKSDNQVLGRYDSADLEDLERSMFEMAGFRFSFTT